MKAEQSLELSCLSLNPYTLNTLKTRCLFRLWIERGWFKVSEQKVPRHAYVARQIVSHREGLGMSTSELARKARIAQATLWRYETGRQARMDVQVLISLAEALEISLNQITGYLNPDIEIEAAAVYPA